MMDFPDKKLIIMKEDLSHKHTHTQKLVED